MCSTDLWGLMKSPGQLGLLLSCGGSFVILMYHYVASYELDLQRIIFSSFDDFTFPMLLFSFFVRLGQYPHFILYFHNFLELCLHMAVDFLSLLNLMFCPGTVKNF